MRTVLLCTMLWGAASTTPSGSYSGSAIVGHDPSSDLDVSVYPNLDGTLDVSARGAFYTECSGPPGETYEIDDDGTVTFPGINDEGDCLYDSKNGRCTMCTTCRRQCIALSRSILYRY